MTRGNTLNKRPGPVRRSASVASLPTPPRTTHKRKRALRVSHDEDSDGESSREPTSSDLSSDEDSKEIIKRRKLALDDNDADAFWLSADASTVDDVPLVLKNFRKRAASSLASPPPSFRGKVAHTLTSPPSTPPRKVNPSSGPVRDSPANPFLASPLASDEEVVESPTSPNIDPLSSWDEQPTITMLYRGSKRVFANPNYDPETGRAKPINPNSLLDPSHPDFEPDFRPRPCVLFAKRKRHPASDPVKPTETKPSGPSAAVLESLRNSAPQPPFQSELSLSDEAMDRYFSRIASGTPF